MSKTSFSEKYVFLWVKVKTSYIFFSHCMFLCDQYQYWYERDSVLIYFILLAIHFPLCISLHTMHSAIYAMFRASVLCLKPILLKQHDITNRTAFRHTCYTMLMALCRAFNCRILYGLYLPAVILTVIWYSITHSLLLSRLKTFLLCKSFPLQPFLSST